MVTGKQHLAMQHVSASRVAARIGRQLGSTRSEKNPPLQFQRTGQLVRIATYWCRERCVISHFSSPKRHRSLRIGGARPEMKVDPKFVKSLVCPEVSLRVTWLSAERRTYLPSDNAFTVPPGFTIPPGFYDPTRFLRSHQAYTVRLCGNPSNNHLSRVLFRVRGGKDVLTRWGNAYIERDIERGLEN
jgi:hypothetical protein